MDIYYKLRPHKTPDSEMCHCSGSPPFVLQSTMTPNPIVCADCNLEIGLDKLNFNSQVVEQIADWRNFYDAFYFLWLDSGEFENWARNELINPESPVNQRGLFVTNIIARNFHECFYWWFVDNSLDEYEVFENCPNCNQELQKRFNEREIDQRICPQCKIIIVY